MPGRRRVLHCIATMKGGGAERQLTYLSQGLVQRGWDVHVAITVAGTNMNRLQSSGAEIHYLSRHPVLLLPQLTKLTRRLQPDIVMTWLPKMDVLGGIAGRLAGVPWVLSERNTGPLYTRTSRDLTRAFLGARAHAIVANSAQGHEYWRPRVRESRRLHFIPNPVPTTEISAAPEADEAETGVSPDHVLVLYAGRLDEQKNVVTLVKALEIVVATNPRIRAVICGEGLLREQIIDFARSSRFTNQIVVHGYVNNLWSWMKRADVFVSVSLYEGRPNTVLEAMACGCPLVVSNIPEHQEFLDDASAAFVRPDLPDEIAKVIVGVLTDREEALRRAAHAQATLQNCSIDENAARYEAVYLSVIDSKACWPTIADVQPQ
jgi:glycosyltransferase involved in cell wall biosynthesis